MDPIASLILQLPGSFIYIQILNSAGIELDL